MGAAERQEVWCAGLAAVQREVLTHDADGHGFAWLEILGAEDRLPERTQIAPSQRPRTSMNEIRPVGSATAIANDLGLHRRAPHFCETVRV